MAAHAAAAGNKRNLNCDEKTRLMLEWCEAVETLQDAASAKLAISNPSAAEAIRERCAHARQAFFAHRDEHGC